MKLRFWRANPPDEAESCWCSGDCAGAFSSAVGEVIPPTTAVGGGRDGEHIDGDWGSTWGGMGGCGVLGLELPVEVPLGGTMGDWEPEEGL